MNNTPMNNISTPEPETQMRITDWLREHPRRQYHDAANYIDSLERERDSLEDQRDFARNMIRVLERERDEAREKLERQAERIRYLEGATNHATGTPLTVALRERDEAQNEIIGWKNKWDCAIELAARAENALDEMTLRWERTNDALFDERALSDQLADALRDFLNSHLVDAALTAWKEARK